MSVIMGAVGGISYVHTADQTARCVCDVMLFHTDDYVLCVCI